MRSDHLSRAAKVPSDLWAEMLARYPWKPQAFDLLLRDGSVLSDVAIAEDGEIGGEIVGGHDGVREFERPPAEEDIAAVRLKEGILGTFYLRPWIRCRSRL